LADLVKVRAAPALPETAGELCDVGRSAGASSGDIYLGRRAAEQSIKALSQSGMLAKYKVLHFATHGTLAGELKGSNEPGLILSPPETATAKDDGYLSASEIGGLKLDADWVILSACNTAGGETKNAEALSGLAKAFFYAGARSLLVSQWYVNSQATVTLITKAFDELKRDPKIGRAGALRQAMLSLIKSGERTWHPAYWAPFVVVGEGSAPNQSVAAQSTDQIPPLPRQEKSRVRTVTVAPRAKSVKTRRKRPKVIRRKRSRKRTSPPAATWADQYFQK
jgi:CHAT domain-containing protein